jgi:excisionase family DNA binding protein
VASLSRRSNGIWYIVYGQNQRRKWLSTGEVCYGKALRLFRTSATSNQVRRSNTLTALAVAIVAYSSTDLAPATTELYRSSFARLVEIVGDKLVKRHWKLDVESIQKGRDAEWWAKSILFLLEHPEALAEKLTAPTSEIPVSIVMGLNVAHPENMTPDEAAKYLRIPKSSLYKGTSAGTIPHRKLGKLLRFSQKELDEYLLSRRVMSKEERDRVAETKLAELRNGQKA